MGKTQIDLEVVHRWDETSLQLLYKHFYKALVAFSSQIVGRREVSEDLVQETFVNVWKLRNEFKSLGVLRSYLYNSVRNRSISYMRQVQTDRNHQEKFKADSQLFHVDELDEEREEIFRQLLIAIDSLSPKLRQHFLLSIKGKNFMEIAEEMNIHIETVRKQRMRGLKQLRDILSQNEILLLLTLMA